MRVDPACFAAALLDPERPVPAGLRSHEGDAPRLRFAVYRNNVTVGLIDALAARFPATQRIVGEEFFREMARLFVRANPPRSPLLMVYGDAFPGFIERFEPASDVPYLADVARLEAARTRAFHAADATPLDPGALQSVPAHRLDSLRILRHPAAEIVRSPHPVVTIWAMNAGERPLAEIGRWDREDALVTRPQFDVRVRLLPPGGAAFLTALFGGARLDAAIAAALADAAGFDLVANLAGLLSSGAAGAHALAETGIRE